MSESVQFHSLTVSSLEVLTDEAVAITFKVPSELGDTFRHEPGQHVIVRAEIDGADIRRSYSICSVPNSESVTIGVKRLPGGAFSTFATTRLAVGDTLELASPVGDFTIPPPSSPRHIVGIAAGSGITPILSIVSTLLEAESESQATIVFGNRAGNSVMFVEALEAIKNRFPDRFQLINVFSREDGLPLFTGRLTKAKLQEIFAELVDPTWVDEWFLCGPYEMVMDSQAALTEAGVDPASIHDELFFAGPATDLPSPVADDELGAVELTITLAGRTTTTRMRPSDSILDAALATRHELPFSCKGGMCATCKGKVIEGEATMDKNYALTDAEVTEGFVLTCQSHPIGSSITVDYDA